MCVCVPLSLCDNLCNGLEKDTTLPFPVCLCPFPAVNWLVVVVVRSVVNSVVLSGGRMCVDIGKRGLLVFRQRWKLLEKSNVDGAATYCQAFPGFSMANLMIDGDALCFIDATKYSY